MACGGGASWKLKKAAKKILIQTCASFSRKHRTPVLDSAAVAAATAFPDSPITAEPTSNSCQIKPSHQSDSTAKSASNKNVCAICLDPLNYSSSSSPGQAIFTAQCSHAFHFDCISSNIRHGSVTCPICRSLWTQLPRNLHTHYCSLHRSQADPVLQILDDSIATFRVHRRSFLRSARYDDDDPIEPDNSTDVPRLHFSLIPVPLLHSGYNNHKSSLLLESPVARAYLSIKLTPHHPATDLVLVASPNGPHLRLMKQAMALVVFALRPMDRLAIVTYSSAAARIFPLKRMTSYGKRTALQVIDRLFYMGQADPIEGLRKGVKILRDRTYQNPRSFMLHLSDSPTRSYHPFDTELPITIHKFHVGYGFGPSNGFVMHEFEGFVSGILGGAVREVQLRIGGEESRIVRLGELRDGEERRIALIVGESGQVRVEYSYEDDCVKTGEVAVGIDDDKSESSIDESVESILGRTSSVENWEYHDPFMARRWAKHLHGYRG